MNVKTINSNERFPIRVLAEKTTVGTSTLRAWERRYGLLRPERTPKGHRLYNESDVQRVLKIIDLLGDGHSLPAIAELLSTSIETDKDVIDPATAMASIWESYKQSTLDAVRDFNVERIDAVYNEASSLYPVDMITDALIQPVLASLGSEWKEHPESGIAEEHLYTSWLKNKLGARFHHAYTHARGKRIICACLPGTYHEIGLMLFSLSALAHGYRVLYFGANLPLNQLAHIVKRSAAKAVVLSSQSGIDHGIESELVKLMPDLKTRFFLGGAEQNASAAAFEDAGGTILGPNISVALQILERQLPAYSKTEA